MEGDQEQELITTLVGSQNLLYSASHSTLRNWGGLITAKVREIWLGTQGERLCEMVFACIPEGIVPFPCRVGNLH